MRAQILKSFGKSDNFSLENVTKPTPRANEVLVQVKATSVNPVDYKIRSGIAKALAPSDPMILHGDVAGIIEAVGSQVTTFKPGDEVYGCVGGVKGSSGALAEYIACDPALLAIKPRSISMPEAAALPLVSITAWEGLIDRAKIKRGQNILVYGGTGGVGHIAVQIAKAFGARVVATVSSDSKSDIVLKLGADEVINYKNQTPTEYVEKYTGGLGFDIVFDSVGGANIQASFEAAAINGTVVTIQSHAIVDLALMQAKNLTLHSVLMLIPLIYNKGRSHHGFILNQIAKLVDDGKIEPLIDSRVFNLEDVAEAHAYAESGKQVGKVSITIN